MKDGTPIFVKSFGKRVVVSESLYGPTFSLPKSEAEKIKVASGFSKNKKIFTRYQGKDFQIMEILERQTGVLFNDSSEDSTGYIFKHTDRN